MNFLCLSVLVLVVHVNPTVGNQLLGGGLGFEGRRGFGDLPPLPSSGPLYQPQYPPIKFPGPLRAPPPPPSFGGSLGLGGPLTRGGFGEGFGFGGPPLPFSAPLARPVLPRLGRPLIPPPPPPPAPIVPCGRSPQRPTSQNDVCDWVGVRDPVSQCVIKWDCIAKIVVKPCPQAPERPDDVDHCNWIEIKDKRNCIIDYVCEPTKPKKCPRIPVRPDDSPRCRYIAIKNLNGCTVDYSCEPRAPQTTLLVRPPPVVGFGRPVVPLLGRLPITAPPGFLPPGFTFHRRGGPLRLPSTLSAAAFRAAPLLRPSASATLIIPPAAHQLRSSFVAPSQSTSSFQNSGVAFPSSAASQVSAVSSNAFSAASQLGNAQQLWQQQFLSAGKNNIDNLLLNTSALYGKQYLSTVLKDAQAPDAQLKTYQEGEVIVSRVAPPTFSFEGEEPDRDLKALDLNEVPIPQLKEDSVVTLPEDLEDVFVKPLPLVDVQPRSLSSSYDSREQNDSEEEKSSRAASHDCEDTHEQCDYWAVKGQCTANQGFMYRECAKACKMCRTA